MKTWDLLTEEQRAAILAFTHEAPNDEPSGRVEGAIDALIALTTDAYDDDAYGSISHGVSVALLNLTEGLGEQVAALRVAFGLSADSDHAHTAQTLLDEERMKSGQLSTAIDEARAETDRLQDDRDHLAEAVDQYLQGDPNK